MNELTIFDNEQFGKIRTLVIDNEPWFVGKDVARALGCCKLFENDVKVLMQEWENAIVC